MLTITMTMTNYDVSDDGADNRLAQFCTQVKPFGNKTFFSGYFDIFQCECYIRMQMQYAKNLSTGRFELGITLN